jgi:hypothetical protein
MWNDLIRLAQTAADNTANVTQFATITLLLLFKACSTKG